MPAGVYPRKGHSEETKRKIALGNTGKIFSKERCKAISEANKQKIDDDFAKIAKIIIEERVCHPDAALLYLGKKRTVGLTRALERKGVIFDSQLKFFNREIDYKTGKKLLAYLKLQIHPREIQKRLGIKNKTFWGSARKLTQIHDFVYAPKHLSPRSGQTKIEKMISDHLDEMNVEYDAEYSFGRFFYDFHIKNTGLFIEVNGDYWHANPLIYPNKDLWTQVQKSNVRRDHYKRRFAREGGFYVLYIWENDLKTDIKLVTNILEKYIRKSYEKARDIESLS